MSRHNLRELRSGVRGLLGQEMDQIIQPAEIDDAIDKALKQINKRFELLQSMWTATSTADKALYRLPPGLVKIDRVEFDDADLDFMDEKNISDMGTDLDAQTPDWTEVVT